MDLGLSTILDLVSKAGVFGFSVLALVAFWKEWIIPGRAYERLAAESKDQIARIEKDRDDWRTIALNITPATSDAIGLAERGRNAR